MRTRADYWVGRGKDAEWLGSTSWDGYPDGVPKLVIRAIDETNYRFLVADLLKDRDSATSPEMGWPWPWEDSSTTDYAYTWDDGIVWASCFGHNWFDPKQPEPEHSDIPPEPAVFPDMTSRQRVTF